MRTLISRDFDAAFEQVDVLVSPTTPTSAFRSASASTTRWPMYLATSARSRQPGRRPGHLGAVRTRPEAACRSACRSWRRRWPTTGCYRVAAALEADRW